MWAYESVFYQIYPLGFCDAPKENDGIQKPRMQKIKDWLIPIQKLGINAIYLGPIFESDSHGYDTRDYLKIDCRLGTSSDFASLCHEAHQLGIRIILDGVFNHVGRGFWAFQDVLIHRENSAYKDWFLISFDGDNAYQDHLWYEGWEGHYELVKLNLANLAVRNYLLDCVHHWIEDYQIDGLRLDVAYSLNHDFIRELRHSCDSWKSDFFLLGEMLHGDYNTLVNEEMLHSCTNYECYKGLYSSFNSMNLFEITHSLLRQFGPEQWTLYRGKHLLCFVDNHDVTRIASMLTNPNHLPVIYGLLFGMPGIPCIYYGSEWGTLGSKENGSDAALRPSFASPCWNSLTEWIATLAAVHKNSPELIYGDFSSLVLTNRQVIFERSWEGHRILVAINADGDAYQASLPVNTMVNELLSGQTFEIQGSISLPPYSVQYLRMK